MAIHRITYVRIAILASDYLISNTRLSAHNLPLGYRQILLELIIYKYTFFFPRTKGVEKVVLQFIKEFEIIEEELMLEK